jgi:hypothetical protein
MPLWCVNLYPGLKPVGFTLPWHPERVLIGPVDGTSLPDQRPCDQSVTSMTLSTTFPPPNIGWREFHPTNALSPVISHAPSDSLPTNKPQHPTTLIQWKRNLVVSTCSPEGGRDRVLSSDDHGYAKPAGLAGTGLTGTGAGEYFSPFRKPAPVSRVCGFQFSWVSKINITLYLFQIVCNHILHKQMMHTITHLRDFVPPPHHHQRPNWTYGTTDRGPGGFGMGGNERNRPKRRQSKSRRLGHRYVSFFLPCFSIHTSYFYYRF